MTWDIKDKEKNIIEAYESYSSVLKDQGLEKSEIEEFENSFRENAELAEIEWIDSSELSNYKPIHDGCFSKFNSKKNTGIIVIAEDCDMDRNLILDGNHRVNTILKEKIKVKVPVLKVIATLKYQDD